MQVRSAIVLVALAACGPSRPDIDPDKQMADLTASERRALCEYKVDLLDGPRKEWCADDYYVQIDDVDDCTRNFEQLAGCDTNVAELERCWDALADDACDGASSDACDSCTL